MDLFDKLNAGIEPLQGPLFVDAFVAARQVERARREAARRKPAAPMQAAAMQADGGEVAGPARRPAAPPREPARRKSVDETPPGGLQAEVEAFLTRDQVEGIDDAEVQEFLKERSGFDPTELE